MFLLFGRFSAGARSLLYGYSTGIEKVKYVLLTANTFILCEYATPEKKFTKYYAVNVPCIYGLTASSPLCVSPNE